MRQWVLSLPISLRLLLAVRPELGTPVLQVVQRVVTHHLLDVAQFRTNEGHGAVTLILRFGSAVNLNIHLHWRVLDGVCRRRADRVTGFVEATAPTDDRLHALLQTVIARLMKMLTRRGVLIEETDQTYTAEPDADSEVAPPAAAAAGGVHHLPHRFRAARRAEGADAERCDDWPHWCHGRGCT